MDAGAGSAGRLRQALPELAVLPDDASSVDQQLNRIVRSAVLEIRAVDYASVTIRRDGTHTTVAMTSDLALAVDESQYADDAGPCVDAASGTVAGTPDTATVVEWPRFGHDAAALGLRSVLSVPLFTASGLPWISLNLYAHAPGTLMALALAVEATYGGTGPGSSRQLSENRDLDEGGRDLVAGLTEALERRNLVQCALGVLMGREHVDAASAYIALRSDAADRGQSVLEHARALTGLTQRSR